MTCHLQPFKNGNLFWSLFKGYKKCTRSNRRDSESKDSELSTAEAEYRGRAYQLAVRKKRGKVPLHI